MEYSSIIMSLCRIGLGSNNAAFAKQVQRLRDSLQKDGKKELAEKFDDLLKKGLRDLEMRPSRLTFSRAGHNAETLAPTVHPPSDKESGVNLAEIIFPRQEPAEYPILSKASAAGVHSVVNEWKHFDQLLAANEAPAHTCLLYGLPGTGKTCIAKAIAQDMNLPLIVARLDGLISSFLGTTARNIGLLFQFANRYNSILLLDEFDAIAKLRNDPQEVGEIKRVVNALIQNLDGRRDRGITIAITNHEELLDPAIWRRFQLRIHIPIPDLAAREDIVKIYFGDSGLKDVHLKFAAWLSEGMTGADIETMARTIRRHRTLNPSIPILDIFRTFAITHAGADDRAKEFASWSDDDVVSKLTNASKPSFTQQDLADLLDRNQATISRWKNKDKLAST